jgi:hypothetical protein
MNYRYFIKLEPEGYYNLIKAYENGNYDQYYAYKTDNGYEIYNSAGLKIEQYLSKQEVKEIRQALNNCLLTMVLVYTGTYLELN